MANYETREFTVEALEELDLPYSDAVIFDEVIDHMRWEVVHRLVFADGGEFFEVTYSEPATEYQEGGHERWGGDSTVTAKVVVPKQITTIQFVPVPKKG